MNKILMLVLFLTILAVGCQQAPSKQILNESNKCLVLTRNLENSFKNCNEFKDCDIFKGEIGKDFEMGGILADYEKMGYETSVPYYYVSQGNLETDDYGHVLSVGGKGIYIVKIRMFNTTAVVIVVAQNMTYKRGKFYKFNTKEILGFDDYNGTFIEELTEVNECNNNAEYMKYASSQPGYEKDYFCEHDSDCIIRTNNYRKVRAYHVKDLQGIAWENTIQTGSPGHTIFPNPEDVMAKCDYGKCIVAFDCSQCDILKQRLAYCEGENPPVTDMSCGLYQNCNCQ